MSRGFPSMTALLGLLAIAGYQNRDKIAEMLSGAQGAAGPRTGQSSPAPGPLGNLGGLLTGTSPGNVLSGGLRELVEAFRGKGHGEVADSWVGHRPNRPVTRAQLEEAIGPDVVNQLSQHTGLSREELLTRLSKNLPEAVDKYTPDGRLPS